MAMKFPISAFLLVLVAPSAAFVPSATSSTASTASTASSTSTSRPMAVDSPSMAQTHMQVPLQVMGSGKSLTKAELDAVKQELQDLKQEFGYKEPVRSFMDENVEKSNWRFGDIPDYSLTNLLFLKQRTKNHDEGSLPEIVENLVKTWEMERSHKLDPTTHQSVDQDKFRISANGGKVFDNVEANHVGNYNVLLNSCPADLYDSTQVTWEQSHVSFTMLLRPFLGKCWTSIPVRPR